MSFASKRIWTVLAVAAAIVMAWPGVSYAQNRAYDLAQLDGATRSAVEQARVAQTRAIAAAARAQGSGAGTLNFQAQEGDRYFGEGYGAGATVQRNGYGLLTWDDGEFYAGEFRANHVNGYKEGAGVYTFVDGRMYEGQWVNDLRHGYGVQWHANGQIDYAGLWVNGNPAQQ